MIELRNKAKVGKSYNLTCSIAKVGAKGETIALKKDKKTGEIEQSKFKKAASEKVLTLQAGESRKFLPDAVLMSPEIASAVERGELLVKKMVKKEEVTKKKEAQSNAAPAKKDK